MNQTSTGVKKIPDYRKTRILIVEDDQDHLYFITRALKESMPGVNAIGTTTGEEALNYLKNVKNKRIEDSPKLILLDLYLPSKAEGLSTLKSLKNHYMAQNQPPAPIVVFSYSNHTADINDCYQQGANAYMVKSSDYEEWMKYFRGLRDFWLETVRLPLEG